MTNEIYCEQILDNSNHIITDSNNNILKFEFSYLLYLLETEYPNHIFKLKTKKIYTQFYKNDTVNISLKNKSLVNHNTKSKQIYIVNNVKEDMNNQTENKVIPKKKSNLNQNHYNNNNQINKRKIYVKETDAFSDERIIQDIRNVLGKVSIENKNYVIDVLKKNISIIENENIMKECIELLLQYANLCLEWNDLYLEIYHLVYYTKCIELNNELNSNSNSNSNYNMINFHKNIYIQCEELIWNHKKYDTDVQTIFFRLSNLDLFIKLSMKYPTYCKELCKNKNYISNNEIVKSFEEWFIIYYILFQNKLFDENIDINEKLDWMEIIIQYFNSFIKLSDNYLQNSIKKIHSIYNNNKYKVLYFNNLNDIIINKNIPMKTQFKWMEITDRLN